MRKEEILNILYLERERLQSSYQMPGWSKWAIIAAIYALVMQIVDIVLLKTLSIRLASSVSFILFNTLILLCFIKELFFVKHSPIWGRNSVSKQLVTICLPLFFVGQDIWIFYSVECIQNHILYYMALSCSIFFTLLYLAVFFLGFFETFKNNKTDKIAFLYPFMLLPLIYVHLLYIYENTGIDNLVDNVHLGIYVFAILCLGLVYHNEFSLKLNKIDVLIDKTLYDNNPDFSDIIGCLENITMGLRAGKHILETQHDYITFYIDSILRISNDLMAIISNSNDIQSCSSILQQGIKVLKGNVDGLRFITTYFKQMSTNIYESNCEDKYKKRMDQLADNLNSLISTYDELFDKSSTMSIENFADYYTLIYNSKIKTIKPIDFNCS